MGESAAPAGVHGSHSGPALPSGVCDRWLTLQEAGRLSRRAPAQLRVELGRGRLQGRRRKRRRRTDWEIRLSELNRYVGMVGMGARGGPRPQYPTTLDWELLSTFPPPAPEREQAA